jgi:hypothetical protein
MNFQKHAVNTLTGWTFIFHMGNETSDHLENYHVLKSDPVPLSHSAFRDMIHTQADTRLGRLRKSIWNLSMTGSSAGARTFTSEYKSKALTPSKPIRCGCYSYIAIFTTEPRNGRSDGQMHSLRDTFSSVTGLREIDGSYPHVRIQLS